MTRTEWLLIAIVALLFVAAGIGTEISPSRASAEEEITLDVFDSSEDLGALDLAPEEAAYRVDNFSDEDDDDREVPVNDEFDEDDGAGCKFSCCRKYIKFK